MQIAAVIAARFNENAPSGASSAVSTPVQPITGETGTSKPEARITATPGTFCEAMVTTNIGNAMPSSAASENRGVTQSGWARVRCACSRCRVPLAAATSTPTSRQAITA